MKIVTPTELRANIYKLLDEILQTGEPIEIMRGNRLLRIAPVEKHDKFPNLVSRPDVIRDDLEDLVAVNAIHAHARE